MVLKFIHRLTMSTTVQGSSCVRVFARVLGVKIPRQTAA